MIRGAEKCEFAARIAQNDLVRSFFLETKDGFSIAGEDSECIVRWLEYCSNEKAAFSRASYTISGHVIKIEFSQNGEVVLIREKSDRNPYLPILQEAEEKTFPRAKKI